MFSDYDCRLFENKEKFVDDMSDWKDGYYRLLTNSQSAAWYISICKLIDCWDAFLEILSYCGIFLNQKGF